MSKSRYIEVTGCVSCPQATYHPHVGQGGETHCVVRRSGHPLQFLRMPGRPLPHVPEGCPLPVLEGYEQQPTRLVNS